MDRRGNEIEKTVQSESKSNGPRISFQVKWKKCTLLLLLL
jgi:hypothetical protein